MGVLSRILEPNNLRLLFGAGGWLADVAQEMREDARFAGIVRRGLFPPKDEAPPAIPILELRASTIHAHRLARGAMLLGLLAAACRPPPESPPTYPEPRLVPIAASDPPVIAMPTPVDAATATIFDVSSGDLHVTYAASGPDGQPQLTYVRGTQNLTFAGPQIRTVTQTDLGTLVSVTIWRTVDAGSTSFTLVVPPVILVTPDTPVNVTLLGITTTHRFGVVRSMNRGQLAGYSQVTLTGTALR